MEFLGSLLTAAALALMLSSFMENRNHRNIVK